MAEARDPVVYQIIKNEWAAVGEPNMAAFLDELSRRGADCCWHKHGTFKMHLFEVWRILRIWRQPQEICRCGLFHSAYSNSYVNLAIFDPKVGRETLEGIAGEKAEKWIYLFCTIDRFDVVYHKLLPLDKVPADGITVPHIRTKEPVHLSREQLGQILIMTIADFADQLFGWQDAMFEMEDGKLGWQGDRPHCLWPGDGRPGLWLSCLSRMARLARDSGVEPLPPVFDHCTSLLSEANERIARDAYWDTVCHKSDPKFAKEAEAGLRQAIEHNPHVGEPHAVLAQLLNSQSRFDEALVHARKAQRTFEQWGTNWDKRMPWEAWVAWARVQENGAREKRYPQKAWGMINLGLVRDD